MLKPLRILLLASLVVITGVARAGIADDLMALVNNGKTLADAVAQLVAANPAQAGEIVAVATDLMYRISPEQCALDEHDKPLVDCTYGLVSAAIGAGGDPGAVTEGAAAGGGAPGGIAGGAGGGGGLLGSAG